MKLLVLLYNWTKMFQNGPNPQRDIPQDGAENCLRRFEKSILPNVPDGRWRTTSLTVLHNTVTISRHEKLSIIWITSHAYFFLCIYDVIYNVLWVSIWWVVWVLKCLDVCLSVSLHPHGGRANWTQASWELKVGTNMQVKTSHWNSVQLWFKFP